MLDIEVCFLEISQNFKRKDENYFLFFCCFSQNTFDIVVHFHFFRYDTDFMQKKKKKNSFKFFRYEEQFHIESKKSLR